MSPLEAQSLFLRTCTEMGKAARSCDLAANSMGPLETSTRAMLAYRQTTQRKGTPRSGVGSYRCAGKRRYWRRIKPPLVVFRGKCRQGYADGCTITHFVPRYRCTRIRTKMQRGWF